MVLKPLSCMACLCRLLFEDDKHAVHLYNAVNDQLLHVEEVAAGLKTAMWDAADPNLLLLSDGKMLYAYVYMPTSLNGPSKFAYSMCPVKLLSVFLVTAMAFVLCVKLLISALI